MGTSVFRVDLPYPLLVLATICSVPLGTNVFRVRPPKFLGGGRGTSEFRVDLRLQGTNVFRVDLPSHSCCTATSLLSAPRAPTCSA